MLVTWLFVWGHNRHCVIKIIIKKSNNENLGKTNITKVQTFGKKNTVTPNSHTRARAPPRWSFDFWLPCLGIDSPHLTPASRIPLRRNEFFKETNKLIQISPNQTIFQIFPEVGIGLTDGEEPEPGASGWERSLGPRSMLGSDSWSSRSIRGED